MTHDAFESITDVNGRIIIWCCSYDELGVTITGSMEDEHLSGEIIIPSRLRGKPVIAIDSCAFMDCMGLTAISIPKSIIAIDPSHFLVVQIFISR